MFTEKIVKDVLESVLNCHKESTFKYVYLNTESLESFSTEFLNEDKRREQIVNCDDLYEFTTNKLLTLGYTRSSDGIYLNNNLFGSKNNLINFFNLPSDKLSCLIKGADQTNLELLEMITKVINIEFTTTANNHQSNEFNTLFEKISLDLSIFLNDVESEYYKEKYEYYTLSLLSYCFTAKPFINILKVARPSFKLDIYNNIYQSPASSFLLKTLISDFGATDIPSDILVKFMLTSSIQDISEEAFISILRAYPISTVIGNDTDEDKIIFDKYMNKISSLISSNTVHEQLLVQLKDAATPLTINGCLMLKLLSDATTIFFKNNQNFDVGISQITSKYNNTVNPVQSPAYTSTGLNQNPANINTINEVTTAHHSSQTNMNTQQYSSINNEHNPHSVNNGTTQAIPYNNTTDFEQTTVDYVETVNNAHSMQTDFTQAPSNEVQAINTNMVNNATNSLNTEVPMMQNTSPNNLYFNMGVLEELETDNNSIN